MASRSKAKGSNAEREVARLLTDWWGGPQPFKRVPNSGALRWAGVTWAYGDILPPDDFQAVVESKWYREIDVDEIIRCKPQDNNVLGWWSQVRGDAERCHAETGKIVHPVLIYRANRRTHRLVLEADLWSALGGSQRGIPSLGVSHPSLAGSLVISELAPFLATVRPEEFRAAARMVVPASLLQSAGETP